MRNAALAGSRAVEGRKVESTAFSDIAFKALGTFRWYLLSCALARIMLTSLIVGQ